MSLKGEMSMLNVLHVDSCDIEKIKNNILSTTAQLPHLFHQRPLVVDVHLLAQANDGSLTRDCLNQLKQAVLEAGFVPVALRGIKDMQLAEDTGWAVLKDASTDEKKKQASTAAASDENTPQLDTMLDTMVVEKPVRSGQQVYAKQAELIITSHTGQGSEVIADGSIHIYGALRGRVMAGVSGNRKARIVCQSLEAELIGIAGVYQLLEDNEAVKPLFGQAVMISLNEQDKIVVKALH